MPGWSKRTAAIAALLVACPGVGSGQPPCPGDGAASLRHPTDLAMAAGFGPAVHPLLKQQRLHAGVDFPGPAGTPVRAAASGHVLQAGRSGAAGNLIAIRHGDGSETHYHHLARIAALAGSCVAAGEVIATLGATGLASEPHLHFEVHVGGEPVDPVPLLPVR